MVKKRVHGDDDHGLFMRPSIPEPTGLATGGAGEEVAGDHRMDGGEVAVGFKPAPGETLEERMQRLTFAIEKMNLAEYTTLLQNPWRLLWVNFIAGSARGLGLGVGFAILTALVIYVLRGLMMANLPVIGDFIATIVRIVETNLHP